MIEVPEELATRFLDRYEAARKDGWREPAADRFFDVQEEMLDHLRPRLADRRECITDDLREEQAGTSDPDRI